jgi:hypothetical protein
LAGVSVVRKEEAEMKNIWTLIVFVALMLALVVMMAEGGRSVVEGQQRVMEARNGN